MTAIAGSVRVGGFIAPSDSTDTYAVTDEIYNRGGYRTVADQTAREAITTDRRKEGMLVKQISDLTYWTLEGGIANSDWVEFAGGGGMVYPSIGIPLSTGSAWGTSITDNSANWNTAYGWGNHASAGYLTALPNHNLIDTTHHPVSGLTTGHFLKATGATTYGFAAHGLTYSDVGAQQSDATLTALAGLTITQGSLIYGTGTDAFSVLAKGTAAQVLKMNAGATAPEWGTITGLLSSSNYTNTDYDFLTTSGYGLVVGEDYDHISSATSEQLLVYASAQRSGIRIQSDLSIYSIWSIGTGCSSAGSVDNFYIRAQQVTGNFIFTRAGVFTVPTAITADIHDGATIGSAAVGFSDAYLATGAVITFGGASSPDCTLTHATGKLTSSKPLYAPGFIDTFAALTITSNATTWDCSGGLNKTVSASASFTMTLTNFVSGMFGDLKLTITNTPTITLAASGVTFKGLGSISAIPAGTYHFCWVCTSATTIEWNIAKYV